jgi:hypothetical protein
MGIKNCPPQVRAEAKVFRTALAQQGFVAFSSSRMSAPAGVNSRQARSIAHKVFWRCVLESAQWSQQPHCDGHVCDILVNNIKFN